MLTDIEGRLARASAMRAQIARTMDDGPLPQHDLFAAVAKHGLTLTPTGTVRGGWVAYNHDHSGRGATPDEAVRDVVRILERRA